MQTEFWTGETRLVHEDRSTAGYGKIFLDLTPRPDVRFEFKPHKAPSISEIFSDSPPGSATIDAGNLIGKIACQVLSDADIYAGITEQQVEPGFAPGPIAKATFLILNGPYVHGLPVRHGKHKYLGRMTAISGECEIIVDRLKHESQNRRSTYEATDVAQICFTSPADFQRVQKASTNIFRTLSLMKCRWVGLVGPWFYDACGNQVGLTPSVTKTMLNGNSITWCHKSLGDSFSQLFPAVEAAFSNPARSEAMQTALHWLIESEQCAGGVEGALILQQAALECLAWLEIVQLRRLCSDSGFKQLPANDKIRWLLSIHNIAYGIPSKSQSIAAYAKAFNLADLTEVLVDVRNALVHAEPKKTARLFARTDGDEERSDLWYQIGGVLQQALLASIGYNGRMLRRDLTVENAFQAIKPVPWVCLGSAVNGIS